MPPRTTARQSKPGTAELAKTAPGLVKQDAPHGDAVGTFSFMGTTYRLSAKQGVWPLLQFARAAEAGMRTDDPRGLAAIHAFLEDVIDEEDWPVFQEDMIKKKMVDLEALLKATQEGVQVMLAALQSASEKNGDGG